MPLTTEDLRRLREASGLTASEIVEWLEPSAVDMTGEPESFVVVGRGRRALMTLRHGASGCRFFGEDARCGVYAARPASCRLYPFAPSFGSHGGLRRLRLLGGDECRHARDGRNDAHALRASDARRWAEQRAYLEQVALWNRAQSRRARFGHALAGPVEFLAFLGFGAGT